MHISFDYSGKTVLVTGSSQNLHLHRNMQNRLPEDIFLFGASCSPYALSMDIPMEEWDRDMAAMRKLNFNMVRIFTPWDRIEIEEGVYDDSKADYLFDLAAKHGLRVIVNIGGLFGEFGSLYKPHFLYRTPRPAGADSLSATPTPRRSFCHDDPEFRRMAMAHMERIVRRYSGRDELLAWMIWNEPVSPFCYCPHTQEKFRQWAQAKHGTLEKVNAAWGTKHPLNYKEWSQIEAPCGPDSLPMWYDWVRFNQQRLTESLREISEMTARVDPRQRPTTSNFVQHMAGLHEEKATPHYGLDMGRAGNSMSILGFSFYAVEHEFDLSSGYLHAYEMSRLRSASLDEHRRLLVLETGAGTNWRMLTEDQRDHAFWHMIAHNVKSFLLWNYRSRLTDGQVALFNLMKWDGAVTARARRAAEFSAMLQANAKLLNRVYPDRQAAILTLEDQQIALEALGRRGAPLPYSKIHDSRLGAYKLLWDMQIPADCIAENNLDDLSRYRLLLLPMAEHIAPEMADRLRRYVADGGTVIAESPFAFRDSDGWLQYSAPAFGLQEVFGCRTSDREGRETAPSILCPEGTSEVCFYWNEYELCGGEMLAVYETLGTAAVVAHRYGKGKAILAGTEVFRQYIQNEQSAMSALLKSEILASGARPTACLEGEKDNIEVSRLAGDGGLVYLVLNHNATPRHFRLELRDSNGSWADIRTGQRVDISKWQTLGGKDVLALRADN